MEEDSLSQHLGFSVQGLGLRVWGLGTTTLVEEGPLSQHVIVAPN